MKNLNLVLNGAERMTKEQMKKVTGGQNEPVSVQCFCDGGRSAGYCLCTSGAECVECCEVACTE